MKIVVPFLVKANRTDRIWIR